MSNNGYFLDACVPIYAAGNDHPSRQPCLSLMEAVAEGSLEAVTDSEVVQETVSYFHRRQRQADGLQLAVEFLEAVGTDKVLSVTCADMVRALELPRSYPFLPPRDAVHLAVMRAVGVTRIITADHHFDRVPGIERVEPNDVSW